ncbi:MAG: hypothetical protein NT091_05200, partial [Candidatus Falkowbacteria bacterium]|nr:hypothetical protein [Candidatus Falkowbacteria bacterium]
MEKKEQSKIDKPDIKIRKEASSLNEFVKRNTPTDEEAHEFNKFMEVSQKDDEMEEGLREIYRNDGGEKLDINTLEKRRGLGIIGWLVYLLFILVVLAGLVWGYYNFVYKKATENNSSVSLVVDGPKTILAGEDVVYKIAYSNPTDVSLKKMEIKVVYPDEFVFGESNPVATGDKTLWQIDSVLPGASGVIEIKGKMVGDKGKNEVMLANMTWKSENSEADFRKEQVLETKISDIGLNVTYDIPVSVFAGQAGNFKINIEPQKINYINNFILRFDPAENIVISKISPNLMPEEKYIEKINDNSWRVIGIADGLTSLNIDFKVLKKITPVEKMTMYFEVPENETKSMLLFNKVIDLSIVKNDFNVSLILNGATNQQGVDFGDVLHYSLVFSNNGETDVNDAIVMAVLDGNILDWSTFKSKQSSVVRDGTVSWTFKDSPALKSIKSGGDGVIDFSINVASLDSIKRKMNANSKYEINSYAQYSLGM